MIAIEGITVRDLIMEGFVMAVDAFGELLVLLVGFYVVGKIVLLLGLFTIVCEAMYSCKHFLKKIFNFPPLHGKFYTMFKFYNDVVRSCYFIFYICKQFLLTHYCACLMGIFLMQWHWNFVNR